MKPMYEIATTRDIIEHRARLVNQLRQDEKQLRRDSEKLHKAYKRISAIGNTLSHIAGLFTPKLDLFLTGFSLARQFWKKKK